MKERPILFNGEMVRAILDGRKTQTRRIFAPEHIKIESHPKGGFYYETFRRESGELTSTGQGPFIPNDWLHYCPYGVAGDRLWVRETFAMADKGTVVLSYRADETRNRCEFWKYRPSIHMPRWASRITLEILKVRVERVQDISNADAIAEGMHEPGSGQGSAKGHYRVLWDSLYGKGAWENNPWVWCISFKKL